MAISRCVVGAWEGGGLVLCSNNGGTSSELGPSLRVGNGVTFQLSNPVEAASIGVADEASSEVGPWAYCQHDVS